jgi:hypothetical protein
VAYLANTTTNQSGMISATTFPNTPIGVRIERERCWGLPSYRVTFENGDTVESLLASQVRQLFQDR